MRSLYESILNSTKSGKSEVFRNLISKIPSKKNLTEIKKIWKENGLDLPKCKWVLRSDEQGYAYVSLLRILINTDYLHLGESIIVICKEKYFDDTIGDEQMYNEWINKIEEKLHIKIKDNLSNTSVWKRIEF